MADQERSPLLREEEDDEDAVVHNRQSTQDDDPETNLESAPLLNSGTDTPLYDGGHQQDGADSASIRSRRSIKGAASRRRWPSIIAMIILGLLSLAIIALAFVVPSAVEEYAKEAAVLEPTNLSLESITADGVRARVQANFKLDSSKVRNDHVRRIGSVATWFVRELGTEATKVNVYLPEYDNVLLGSAGVPPITIKINGDNTAINFVADLIPGEAESIRTIANEWLEGRLGSLRFQGKADLTIKTGIIPLGTHAISESLTVEASELPGMPQYNISKVLFRDIDNETVGAEVSVNAFNKYPFEFVIPPLAFDILVQDCDQRPYITVAEASTDPVDIRPNSLVVANVHGVVKGLPDSLTKACPNSKSSPLDHILKDYLGGKSPEVFVKGKERPGMDTPEWLDQIMSQVIIPVPFPAPGFDRLIRNFTLTDTRFTLPDPMAEPDDPAATPKVSGNIQVIAGLPKEMNFGINVTHIRAAADVFYKKEKLGVLDVTKWQNANSTRIASHKDDGPELKIQSAIKDAPLNVTNGDVLTSVIQQLIFQGKTVILDIQAKVDVKVQTVLGELVLKDVPAEGRIPVKPFHRGGLEGGGNPLARLAPRIGNIMILDSTPDSLKLQALVDITNPTPYSAYVPYVNVHILCNGSTIGEVTAENLEITTGNNTNLVVTATWQPSRSGENGKELARNLLSQYLSGFNTTLSVRAHRDSIPGQPILGEALSHFNITLPAPRMQLPGDDSGNLDPQKKGHFIRDATFHLLSSSATFTLASPLKYNIVYIEYINATAFYNHTEPIGRIIYDLPIAAKPGLSQTPKLPVDWSLDSVGYDKIRKALGGTLKLDASATVKVRVGQWRETIWYIGEGIGASVRL